MKKIIAITMVLTLIVLTGYLQFGKKSPAAVSVSTPVVASVSNKIPTIDTSKLDNAQREKLSKILNDEMCPCGDSLSFLQCLPIASQCKPAVLLGQWLADRIADGVPVDLLAMTVTKEIGGGFAAKPQNIVLSGQARKGAKNPKIRIVEFADFQCVHCRAATKNLHIFADKYPDEIEVLFKHLPLPNHPMALDAAYAAEAAGLQGKFWDMLDALFGNQEKLSKELIVGLAKALKLNIPRFEKDFNSKVVKDKVAQSIAEAKVLGLNATPSFFFNGREYHLSFNQDGFELRRQMELARRDS